MKIKRASLSVLGIAVVGLCAYLYAIRRLDIAQDCKDFATRWANGGAMPNVKLLCGMQPMPKDVSQDAWRLLQKVSGTYHISQMEVSPRFDDTQGVFVKMSADGESWGFGIQGHESEGSTAIEFERALGQACTIRTMRESDQKRITVKQALIAQLPKYIDELNRLGVKSVRFDGYGFSNWDEALAGIEKFAREDLAPH